MTCTDVLDSRIDAAIRTLRALRTLRAAAPELDPQDARAGALRHAQRCLTLQMEALAAARAMCDRAPAPRPRTHGAPTGSLTTDQRGVIVRADASVGALLRRLPAELVGAPLAAIVALPDRRRFGHRLCELIENPDHGEWQTRLSRAGSLISLSVSLRVEVVPESYLLRWWVRDLRELRRAQAETFARQESVRGATRLLRRLARENSRLNSRLSLPPGLDLPPSN
jgi:hypothetical protein